MKWVNGGRRNWKLERLRLDGARSELEAKVKVLNDTVKGCLSILFSHWDLLRT